MTARRLQAGDRPLLWRHMPLPIRMLGKRAKWLWTHGDFPAPLRRTGVSDCWSSKAVQRWCDANAAWLETEGKRWAVLHALDALDSDPRDGGLQ